MDCLARELGLNFTLSGKNFIYISDQGWRGHEILMVLKCNSITRFRESNLRDRERLSPIGVMYLVTICPYNEVFWLGWWSFHCLTVMGC